MSGRKIEDYVEGLQQGTVDNNYNSEREPRGRGTNNYVESALKRKETGSRHQSLGTELNKSGVAETDRPSARSIDEFEDLKNASNSASRQGYALWAQKMGLGKYDACKVLFYHDEEADIAGMHGEKDPEDNDSQCRLDIDNKEYDFDMLNQLFKKAPE